MSVEEHLIRCREAKQVYVSDMEAQFQSEFWEECLSQATDEVSEALRATKDLSDIPAALLETGRHARALRFLRGPPLSQDQFALACPDWIKGTEKTGAQLTQRVADSVAETFERWKDPLLSVSQKDEGDRDKAIYSTAILIAQTEFATKKRMRLAKAQEQSAVDLLLESSWVEVFLGKVDEPGALGERQFARATQFATADGSSHEVDIALGLSGRRILALECKVSHDRTNSIKRTNDVLKKAEAWKKQWGKFVITGALLQGVFGEKEPRRLLEAEVEIFWSHRLYLFKDWIIRES